MYPNLCDHFRSVVTQVLGRDYKAVKTSGKKKGFYYEATGQFCIMKCRWYSQALGELENGQLATLSFSILDAT